MNGESGIVYVATRNGRYVLEAFLSAHSVKDLCPDLPITLFTDKPESPFSRGDCFDNVIPIETNKNFRSQWADGQLDRIMCLSKSPYSRTLHLDTDTRVMTAELGDVFARLDRVDIAMAICQPDASVCASHYARPMFNVGFILYRMSEKIGQLLYAWEELTRHHFELANLDVVPEVDCLSAISDPELRRKLLFMDQTSFVQLLSPEVNKFDLDLEIMDECWNYRGDRDNRMLGKQVIVNHHPNLRSRLGPDAVNRAIRYQQSGNVLLAREIYKIMLAEFTDPDDQKALKILLEQTNR